MGWTLYNGDSAAVLKTLPENSLEVCITDPPYFLGAAPDVAALFAAWSAGEEYKNGRGFMGNEWDGYLPGPRVWREVFRVLKPGAHVLAFGGPRTFDLLTLALRLSGFEIRDALSWLYGSGFPKSLNVSKAIDKHLGAEREVVGPLARPAGNKPGGVSLNMSARGMPEIANETASKTPGARAWEGFGTALKPAWEPIILARKPLSGTVAENILAHGTGALNLDAGRIPAEPWKRNEDTERELGRFPANLLLDEEAAAELDKQEPGASRFFYTAKAPKGEREAGLDKFALRPAGGMEGRRDGSLGGEPVRRKNAHPTVKPLDLMEYLVKLATPPGGTVLDLFSGSGSTGCAALRAGFSYIGIELSEEFFEVSVSRLRHFNVENLFEF